MPRYDRHFDYGLRGYREALDAMRAARQTGPGAPFGREYFPPNSRSGPPNRVTARYNRDYTYDQPYRGDPRDRNAFAGGREERIRDGGPPQADYRTIGGTRTMRGASYPSFLAPREVPADTGPRARGGYSGYGRDFGPRRRY